MENEHEQAESVGEQDAWQETRELDEADLIRVLASPRCAVPEYRRVLQWEVDEGWNGKQSDWEQRPGSRV